MLRVYWYFLGVTQALRPAGHVLVSKLTSVGQKLLDIKKKSNHESADTWPDCLLVKMELKQ